jgi:hypothetical protein
LFRCEVNRVEVANTKKKETRDDLEADLLTLEAVGKEENVSGFSCIPGSTGSFISNPVSDLNLILYNECVARGLQHRDVLLILRAVENACRVFLTLDKKIIKQCQWIEERCGVKIWSPSGLAAELVQQ